MPFHGNALPWGRQVPDPIRNVAHKVYSELNFFITKPKVKNCTGTTYDAHIILDVYTVEPLTSSSSRDPISIPLRDMARWTTWFEPRCAVPNTPQKANFVTTSGASNKSRGRKSQYSPPPLLIFLNFFEKLRQRGDPLEIFYGPSKPLWSFFWNFFEKRKQRGDPLEIFYGSFFYTLF